MNMQHPLSRAIARVLMVVLFADPLVVAAAELSVDAAAGGNTQLGAAGNGVPVVNIATPNGAGLSHNKFRDYNVGSEGLILNNATGKAQSTQLGGIIMGNPNLKNGAAQKILNEVTGSNPSQLRGYTEVAGQAAHVIVANPQGISCDGCGFINTPRATLTTGKPLLDNGRLAGYDVNGGSIAIEGAGVNASNLQGFELITRSAQLNAELYAQQLTVVTGRNQVDAETLAAQAKAEDGSAKPQLAIDSSALGGMYAGSIRLVGTEQGVGVKLAGNMAASAGDIQLDANGQLSLAQTSTAGSLRAKAQDIQLNGPTYAAGSAELNAQGQVHNRQSLAAGQNISLRGQQVTNSGVVEAGVNPDNSRNAQSDLSIQAEQLQNRGSLVAGRTLSVQASQQLDNQGGALKGSRTQINTAQLNNQQGRIVADSLQLSATQQDNRNGRVVAKTAAISGTTLDNRQGLLSAEQQLNLDLQQLDNSGGSLVTDGSLQARVGQSLNNQDEGLLSAKGDLAVQAGQLDNRGGLIVSDRALSVTASGLDNRAGQLTSQGNLTLNAEQIDNSQGGRIASRGDLQARSARLTQQGGELLAQGRLQLQAGQLDNRNGGVIAANQGVQLDSDSLLNQGGELSSQGLFSLQANTLDNRGGRVLGDLGLNLQVQQLINQQGVLASQGLLSLSGQSLDNQGGTLSSQGALSLNLSGLLNNQNQGRITSQSTLSLNAASLNNNAAILSSQGLLSLNLVGALYNQAGKLLSNAGLSLNSAEVYNQGGLFSAAALIQVRSAALDNSQSGRMVGDANIELNTGLLNNQGGQVSALGSLRGQVFGLNQQAGQLFAQTGIDLDLQGQALINSQGGLLSTPGALLLRNVARIDNRGGEISSRQAFNLSTGELLNQGGKLLFAGPVQLNGTLLDNRGGVLSADRLQLSAQRLDNSQGGTLSSRGDLLVNLQGELNNQADGALLAAAALQVNSASLNNLRGILQGGSALSLNSGATDNRNGKLLTQGLLQASTADLDNREGVLSGSQGLSLSTHRLDNGVNTPGQAGGLITSLGDMQLTAWQYSALGGGEVSAKGSLRLKAWQWTQQQAQLIGESLLRLELGSAGQAGDFDNRGSLLSAGSLQIEGLGQLDNRGGEISSGQSFHLVSADLDNGDSGRIISGGILSLHSQALRNANQGLLSGWQGLTLNASRLDNRQSGTLSSRGGALSLSLSGDLYNQSQGALVSLGLLSLNAANLYNAGGILSTQNNLNLNLSGRLDNQQNGLLSAQGALTGRAQSLDNRSGQLNSNGLSFTAQSLDNRSGSLLSQGALSLSLLGNLLNQAGQLASAGDLTINADSLNNSGGQLASQGQLSFTGGSLDNQQSGTLSSLGNLSLSLSGALDNRQDGLVFSKSGQLRVSAASLNNAGGSLQGQSHSRLNIQGLTDNQDGRISSQAGDLELASNSLNNSQNGLLHSALGALTIVSQWFDNRGGTTQAQSLNVQASQGLDNRAGHLSAVAGELRLSSGNLDNQGGGLYATGLLSVSGGQLLNQNSGKIGAGELLFNLSGALNNSAGGLIESANALSLSAASLDNQNGALRSLGLLGSTQLSLSGLLDNRYGRIETANQHFALSSGSLQNQEGSVLQVGRGVFAIDLAQAGLAGGRFVTNSDLSYQAASWTNNSLIQAQQLTLNVDQLTLGANGQLLAVQQLIGTGLNWSNAGQIASDGRLNLNLSGNYNATGRLSSLGDLLLSVAQLDLSHSARLLGGSLLQITSSGTLTNQGRLTSAGDLEIRAASLVNQGTLGSAAQLRLEANSLLNDGAQQGALIFSGADMALRIRDSLSNSYADIYSLGALDVAADDLGAWSTKLINRSAVIESARGMTLRAASIENRKDIFEVDASLISASVGVRCYDCSEVPAQLLYTSLPSHLVWKLNYQVNSATIRETAAASISSGEDLQVLGNEFLNVASNVSAGRNINMTLQNFTNQGAVYGDYSVFKSFGLPSSRERKGFWEAILEYNSINDPEYLATFDYGALSGGSGRGATIDFWNKDWIESREEVRGRAPGATDTQTIQLGTLVYAGEYLPLWNLNPLPAYQPGQLIDPSHYLTDAIFFDERVVFNGPSSYVNAIVQAGGNVTINATQNLTNSVIREGVVQSPGNSRVGSTDVRPSSIVYAINSQLPPDLAQRQVNPLSLPGFSLPQGDNGLFRLSSQAGSGGAAGSVQGETAPSFSGQGSGGASREQALGGNGLNAGDIQVNGGAGNASSGLNVPLVQGVPGYNAPNNSHKYLIETNPELTNLRKFLSSDYLLGLLGFDPDKAQKRLGDGLYEQRLIQNAVVARTGQRFINGLSSDEALFKYLMDNAIAYKDRLQLQLGVSLSAEQVAALTHDIVWLEEAEVNGEKVLVPVLYLAQSKGRLAPNGALIMGQDVSLISGGDLNNQGTLRASQDLAVSAKNLNNSGLIEAGKRLDLLASGSIRNSQGGVISGRDINLNALTGDVINERTVTSAEGAAGSRTWTTSFADNAARIEASNRLEISAGRDINNQGGVLTSAENLHLQAGRDVNLTSAERYNEQTWGKNYRNSTEQLQGELSAGQDLNISAGRDLNAVASRLDAARDAALSAGRDVTLASAADESHSFSKTKRVTRQEDHVEQQSTTLNAGGDVLIDAGENLTLVASKIGAGNEAYLVAGQDVSLESAESSDSYFYRKTKSSGGALSKTQKTTQDSGLNTYQEGSLVSGDSVVIRSGRDLSVIGSDVASTNSTQLRAGRDVRIDGATEVSESSHAETKKKSGIMGSGGIGFSIGTSSMKASDTQHSEQTRGSTIGSVLGNVDIQAGKDLSIRGSDVVAGRDINLIAQNVNIQAAENQNRQEQRYEQKKSGVTLALSGSVGSAINTAYETVRQARDEDDSRLQALQGLKAGLTGVQAWQAAQQNGGMTADNVSQFVGISISAGTQKSKSQTIQEQRISQGSSLSAGNNLNILATGSGEVGEDGDIRIHGSQLKAGQDANLVANRNLSLEAAANTQKLDGKNSSSGGNLGISFGVNSNGAFGLSIFANGNKGSGFEKGNGTSWTESTLDAGRQVTLVSGQDTQLKGAQVNSERITAKVGNNLSLESLQDSDQYKTKQKDVSGGASLTLGSGGSVNLSINKSKIESDYRSVREQTGLYAGQGGFDIEVGKHSQLDGAVIASTGDAEKNRLSTGTLGWSSLKNEAEYETQQQSLNLSSGGSNGSLFIGNSASGMVTGFKGGDSTSGTTHSAIAEGQVEIRDQGQQTQNLDDLSRDTEHANGSIDPIFDKEKEQRRLKEVQLMGELARQGLDIYATAGLIEKQKKIDATKKQADEAAARGDMPTADRLYQQLEALRTERDSGNPITLANMAATLGLAALTGNTDLGGILSNLALNGGVAYLAEEGAKGGRGHDETQALRVVCKKTALACAELYRNMPGEDKSHEDRMDYLRKNGMSLEYIDKIPEGATYITVNGILNDAVRAGHVEAGHIGWNDKDLRNYTYYVQYNATKGVLSDLLQTGYDKFVSDFNGDYSATTLALKEAVERQGSSNVEVYAHSWGTIVTANALQLLVKDSYKNPGLFVALHGSAVRPGGVTDSMVFITGEEKVFPKDPDTRGSLLYLNHPADLVSTLAGGTVFYSKYLNSNSDTHLPGAAPGAFWASVKAISPLFKSTLNPHSCYGLNCAGTPYNWTVQKAAEYLKKEQPRVKK